MHGIREMHAAYIEIIAVVEQLHRQFLDLVKLELDTGGIYDINSVQALMLFNIGEAEMSVGELTLRGCYLGTNVSYNVKKLADNGYLTHMRSTHDRRSVHVRLTEKGLKLRDTLQALHQRHVGLLNQTNIAEDDLLTAAATLRRLERFWTRLPDQSIAAA
jgi:DNA-binding MarR family transcriptional regulator